MLGLTQERLESEPLVVTDDVVSLYSSLFSSSSSSVYLHGPRGVGKRAALYQVAALARAQGWLVLFLPSSSAWHRSLIGSTHAFLSYLYHHCATLPLQPPLLSSPLASPHPHARTLGDLVSLCLLSARGEGGRPSLRVAPLLRHLLWELEHCERVSMLLVGVDEEASVQVGAAPSAGAEEQQQQQSGLSARPSADTSRAALAASTASSSSASEEAFHPRAWYAEEEDLLSTRLSMQLNAIFQQLRSLTPKRGCSIIISAQQPSAASPSTSSSPSPRHVYVQPPYSSLSSFLSLHSLPSLANDELEHVLAITGALPSHLRMLAVALTLPHSIPEHPLHHPLPFPLLPPASPSSPRPLSLPALSLYSAMRDRYLQEGVSSWRRRRQQGAEGAWLMRCCVLPFVLRDRPAGEGWLEEAGLVLRGSEGEEEEEQQRRNEYRQQLLLSASSASSETGQAARSAVTSGWQSFDSSAYHAFRFVHPRARAMFWPIFIQAYSNALSPLQQLSAAAASLSSSSSSSQLSREAAFRASVLVGLLMTKGPMTVVDLAGGEHRVPCQLRSMDWMPPARRKEAEGGGGVSAALPLDVLLLLPPSVSCPTPLDAVYTTLDDVGCPHLVLLSLLPAGASLAPHLISSLHSAWAALSALPAGHRLLLPPCAVLAQPHHRRLV